MEGSRLPLPTGRAVTDAERSCPRAYVAAPIFSPEQLKAVEDVVTVLHEAGFDSYSPARDGVMLKPDDPPEKRDEVYYSNKAAVTRADLLVCILDDRDTGTIWELGCATGAGVPIIAVTLVKDKMNVMLERGVLAHVVTLRELDSALQRLRPHLIYGRKVTNELREEYDTVVEVFTRHFKFQGRTQ